MHANAIVSCRGEPAFKPLMSPGARRNILPARAEVCALSLDWKFNAFLVVNVLRDMESFDLGSTS